MGTSLKVYKKPLEIIQILQTRNLCISQPIRATRILTENNYFFLKGYKELLLEKPIGENYKSGADFEELYAIYSFDKDLKVLLLRTLLEIEQKLKSVLSGIISERYGVKETQYLKKTNYDLTNPQLVASLTRIKKQKSFYGKKNKAVIHYLTKYGYVPLWVLSKAITMGAVRDLFKVMKPSDQMYVANQVLCRPIGVNQKKVNRVKNMIALLVDIRNMCAHDEIIFNFVHDRVDIGIYPEHSSFQLKKDKTGVVIQGRKDLFAVFIAIKYLVSRTAYNQFIQSFEALNNKLMRSVKSFTKEELIEYMGLPIDYYMLKQL